MATGTNLVPLHVAAVDNGVGRGGLMSSPRVWSTAASRRRLDGEVVAGETFVGRFELLALTGTGAHSRVFQARDPVLNTVVAVKLLSDDCAGDPDIRTRFIREARLARSVGGGRVVDIYELGEDGGRPYLVMRHHNETLADRLAARQENLDAVSIISSLVAELHACLLTLERAGIVHRDIKPSNLLIASDTDRHEGPPQLGRCPAASLLDPGERIVLADFGLAKSCTDSKITLGAGTVGYMAPEQALPCIDIDRRADIFSATAVISNWMIDAAVPAESGLSDWIDSGLAPRRENRPSDANSWAEAFHSALATPRSGLRSISTGALALAGISCAIVAMFLLIGSKSTPERTGRVGSTKARIDSEVAETTTEQSVLRGVSITSPSVVDNEVLRFDTRSTLPLATSSSSGTVAADRTPPCEPGDQELEVELAAEFESGSSRLQLNSNEPFEGALNAESTATGSEASARITASSASDC